MKFLTSLYLLGFLLYSSVFCDPPYSADPEWIRIGPNFPPTSTEKGESSQFFYIRGGYDVVLGMKDEFHRMKDVDYFYYKFDVWQSNIEGSKDFFVRPENKTPLAHDQWNTIERRVAFRDIGDWYIRMFAEEKPNMVIALKNIEVNYETYTADETSDDSIQSTIDSHTVHSAPNTDIFADEYDEDVLLFNCDSTECSVHIPPVPSDRTVGFELWHSEEAHTTGDLELKTNSGKSRWSRLEKVQIEKGKPFDFRIVTSNSDAARLLVTGKKLNLQYSEVVPFETSEVRPYTSQNRDSKMLVYNADAEDAVHFIVGPESTMKDECFVFNYDIVNIPVDTVSVAVISYDKSTSNRYKLFDIDGRTVQSTNHTRFCVQEFLFDAKDLLDKNKFQMFISVQISKRQDNSLLPKFGVFSVEIDKDGSTEASETLNFITARDAPWTRTIPELVVVNNRTLRILDNDQIEQVVQMNTVWMRNHPDLTDHPLYVHLKINGFQHSAVQEVFLETLDIQASLCDDLSDCITARFLKSQEDAQPNEFILSFQFDHHPSKSSKAMKLYVKARFFNLDPAANVELSLDSFGDPCYGETTQCKDLFGDFSVCDSTMATEPNDYRKACSCKADQSCVDDDKNTYIGHVCLPKPENSVECICKQQSNKPLLTWSKDAGCKEFENLKFIAGTKVAKDRYRFKWDSDFRSAQLKNYDVCFRLNSNRSDSGIATLEANLHHAKDSVELFSHPVILTLNEADEVIADFCLSDFVDIDHESLKDFQQIQFIVESETDLSFNHESLVVYGKDLVFENDRPVKKVSTTANGFEALSVLPSNVINLPRDGFFRFMIRKSEGFEVRIFGEWMKNYRTFNSDQIDRNILTTENEGRWNQKFEICRPRTAAGGDCIEYTEKRKISSILNSLDTDRFQIVLVLKADEPAEQLYGRSFPVGSVSLWDTCTVFDVKCQNGAKCSSAEGEDVFDFTCDSCPKGFDGKLCHLKYDDSCTVENEKICKQHNTVCVPESRKQFRCDCPKGYGWNHEKLTCERMVIEKFSRKCWPNFNSDDCWLNATLFEKFRSLPKYFPLISADESKKESNILFTFTSGSKISMTFENIVEGLDDDYCLSMKYFLSPASNIIFTVSDKHVLTLDSTSFIDPKVSLPLSETTTICLRALFPFEEFTKVGKWKLDIEARIRSSEETVAIQLLPSLFDRMLDMRTVDPTEQASTNLTFLSPMTEQHSLLDETVRKQNSLTFQWPVQIPNQKVDFPKNAPSSIVYTNSPAGRPDTIDGLILESTWISRPIASSRNISGQVNLYFEMFIKEGAKDANLSPVTVDMNLLNENREIFHSASLNDKLKPNGGYEKHSFALNSKVTVDSNTLYKVQLIIHAANRTKTLPDFEIHELSFGDPCIVMKRLNKNCYSLDNNGKAFPNPDAECERIQMPNGDVELKCACDDHLEGKYCSEIDYCSMNHEFRLLDEKNEYRNYEMTGKDYCGENAQCHNWLTTSDNGYNFVCICPFKAHQFNAETRVCEPLSKCTTNKCNPNTQECDEETMSCKCKDGYEDAKKDGNCVPLSENCDAEKLCPSKMMECRRDKKSSQPICTCPPGFQFRNNVCESIMCQYPGLTNCEHYCTETGKDPYFRCECEERYYRSEDTKNGNVTTNRCVLKSNAPDRCKNCDIKEFRVCVPGSETCVCKKDFVENADGKCVPQPTIQWKACPNGQTKLDNTGKLVCDCDNSTLPYFNADKGACRLTKNICSDGEEGRKVCDSRNAGCLPSMFGVEDYQCICPEGMAFYKTKTLVNSLSGSDLVKYSSLHCVDICELPHLKHTCASVGAKCSSLPTNNIQGLPKYCECVTGTFYNADKGSCIQISNSLSFNMTMKWTPNYRTFAKSTVFREPNPLKQRQQAANNFMNLDVIDALGYSRALRDAHYDNLKTFQNYQQEVDILRIRAYLEFTVQQLFYGAKIIRDVNDIHIARFSVDMTDAIPTVSMQLGIKYPLNEDDISGVLSLIDEDEDLVRTEMVTRFRNDLNKTVVEKCGKLKDDSSCVMAFLNHGTLLQPDTSSAALNLPCTIGQNCFGMSDCIAMDGSQFQCRCNADYFNVEQSFSFDSFQSDILLKNELCLPKNLCSNSCNSETEVCNQKSPVFDAKASKWTIEKQCGCNNDTALVNEECVSVCRIANCTKNGKCVRTGPHQAKCECDKDFYGERCEHETPSNVVWIIVVSVLGVLAVAAIGAAIFLYISKQSHSTRAAPVVIRTTEQQATRHAQPPPPASPQNRSEINTEVQRQQQQQQTVATHQTTARRSSIEVIGDSNRSSLSESFANRIRTAVQSNNSYSPSKTQRRILSPP